MGERGRAKRASRAGLLALGCALVFLPVPVSAQVLQGAVVEADTRGPLPAVLVTLVDSDGRDVGRFLTDATGVFRFLLSEPGQYSLKAERLGAETSTVDGVLVRSDETVSVRITMVLRPVALEGIEVSSEPRCELAKDAGAVVHAVWQEARKVLAAQSYTDASAWYRYDLVRYTRRLDPYSLAVRHETSSRRETAARRPIVSRPTEQLLDSGFVVTDPEGMQFFGPDADVLLSDGFLDTHCFGLRAGVGDEEGLLGLEFRPISARAGITEIEGVLWLDQETAHVRWLEFRYRNLPPAMAEVDSEHVGGWVEFRGLDNGTWIVSNWHIRLPVITEERLAVIGTRRLRLSSIVEEGGRVARAWRPGSNRASYAEELGTIEGEVELGPSTSGYGSVLVIGTGTVTQVDNEGRFRLEGLPPGRYQLAYLRREMLGLDGKIPEAEVEVSLGRSNAVRIRPRATDATMATICGQEQWTEGTGILIGEVVRPGGGLAVAGAVVRAEWQSFRRVDLNRLVLDADERSVETITNEFGAFQVCGVPIDTPFRLSARLGSASTMPREVLISPDQPVITVVIESDFDTSSEEAQEAGAPLRPLPGTRPVIPCHPSLRNRTSRYRRSALSPSDPMDRKKPGQ